MTEPEPVELYYSFAGKDTKLADLLEVHLKVLEREETIKGGWSRRKVLAGKETDAEVDEHFERARIILLLLSADFMATDYLYHGELKRALEKHERDEARVIPIRLRSCTIPKNSPLTKLEMVPPAGEHPAGEARTRAKAFSDIADHIRRTVEELQGKRPQQQSQQRSRLPETPSPNFIASLCDRREQKLQLKRALDVQKTRIAEEGGIVPLVCFIHGEFEESLEGFKQRLEKHDIYELLELERNEYSVKKIDLRWPYLESELSNPQVHFEKDLESKVLNQRPSASKQEVLKALGQHPGPVMLCYDVISENWNADSPSIIEAFLSFWGSVPNISSTTPIIVCLFFEYEQPDITSPNVPAQRNAEARDCFRTLEKKLSGSDDRYPPLCGVVLKELGPVSKTEVYEWIGDSRAFAEFCIRHRPSFCNPDEIQRMKIAITRLYSSAPGRDETRKIPMNQLVDSLGRLLNEYRCRT